MQERLALQGAIAGVLSLVFLALLRGFGGRGADAGADAGIVLVALSYLAMWGFTRGSARPLQSLRRLDLGATALAAIGCGLHGWVGPESGVTRLDALLALNNILLVRAILVPSSAAATARIGALALIPVVAPALLAAVGLIDAQGPMAPRLQAALFLAWGTVVWVVPTLVSRVIYDLRLDAAAARRLGPYELGGRIGGGAMGEVFRASHALLRRPTAIKLLRPDRAGAEAIARFEQEVTITASLTHPNTIAVYDFGRTPDRLFYYAMELLDGRDLQALVVESGPLPVRRLVHVLRQVCASLGEAHAAGLVHRDIKPGNVMLCRRGGMHDVVKVVDFGLAQIGATHDVGEDAGLIVGTPAYLAPEGWRGDPVDARTDLYALGVTAYFLGSGQLPFGGLDLFGLCNAHLLLDAPRLAMPGPNGEAGIEEIVARCLRKEPSERFQSAQEVDLALASIEARMGPWTEEEAAAGWSAATAIQGAQPS